MANSEIDCDSFTDSLPPRRSDQILFLLRRHLPLRARAGGRIVAKAHGSASRCTVIQVYDAGESQGLLCHLEFADQKAGSRVLVAPITDLSFDRGSPVFREIVAYQKSRRAGGGGEVPRACARR
ncbi:MULTISPECIES: hypothetical protein [Methylosinus]|nr:MULTISPECIES: hypothetical protein [Methylosinus]